MVVATEVAPDAALLKGLVADEAPKKEEPKTAEEKPKDEPKPEAEKPTEEEKPKDDKPREGTPDKVLQKMQQDTSATNRLLERLLEKVESGNPLTPEEKKQVVKAKTKLDAIQEKLAGGTFDSITDGQELAEALIEERVASENRLKAVEAKLTSSEAEVAKRENKAFWAESKSQWPDLNHKEIWSKSVEDTLTEFGVTAEDVTGDSKVGKLILQAVHKEYKRRCDNAHKSLEIRKEKKDEPQKKAADSDGRFTKTPVVSAPELSEEAQDLARMRALNKD